MVLDLDPKNSSWLVRLALSIYLYWRQDNEWRYSFGRKENFCHFVRIVLFWAPMKWFFTHEYGPRDIQPYKVVAFFALMAALVLGLITNLPLTLEILKFLGIAILGIGAALLWALGYRGGNPIIVPITKVLNITLLILSLCALLFLFGFMTFIHPVETLLAFGTVLVIALIGLGAVKLFDIIYFRRSSNYYYTPKKTSSLRFAWEAIKTFKHNTICPFIKIKGLDYD